ncbi:MAG: efflux RND transporter permease subunit [Planctomycetes bacterium]|nr:efflux RND transporter permease subunit [Planctomycetota bacterium]
MSGAPAAETELAQRSFYRFTTTRPVAVTMVVLATVVFGLVGLSKLPINLLPDIAYPTVTIRTEYPGSSPEDVEERVSERIQDQVSVVQGVRRVTSISRAEVSDVVLEFTWGTEMVFAISDIRERLDRVRLPDEAERPLVLRYDPSLDPVMTFGLTGEADLVELRRIAEEELERELAKIEGVAAVKIRGGDEEEIRISIDEPALGVLGLDIATIVTRLREENVNTAAGTIEEGKTEFLVRTLGEFRNLDEVGDVIVDRRNEGVIRLRDVARVTRVPKEKEVISRIDGEPCVLIDVYKEAKANIVALAHAIRDRTFGTPAQRAYVAGLDDPHPTADEDSEPEADDSSTDGAKDDGAAHRRDLAKQRKHRQMTDFLAQLTRGFGAELELLQDQSGFIETSVAEVRDSAVIGGAFAICIIFLFLRRISSTIILALSIPISIAASFAPIFLSEISLNVMSLGGLALGVGMLVDNSIVVLESIARAREDGHGIRDAAVLGVSRVASAVTASTLTTIAVFFPIVFVTGMAGQLFRDQSLTVVYSLLMSLLVALFVIPMLASRNAPADGEPERTYKVVRSGPLFRAVESLYGVLLGGALRLRWLVLLVAVALLGLAASRTSHLGNELLPEVSQGELYVDLFLPRDATVERTDAVVEPIEREIREFDGVARTFLAVGVDKQELNDSDQGEHSARILVTLAPSTNLHAAEEQLREDVRRLVEAVPEVESFRFSQPSVLTFSAPLAVEVLGRDLIELREVSASVEEAIRTRVPGVRDVRSTLQRGNPEVVIRLDRERMASLELDSGQVADLLRSKVHGDVPTRFAERERKIDMRVGMAKRDLGTVAELLAINVNPNGSPEIPLASIAQVRRLDGPSEIRRIGNVRGAEVQATVIGFDLGTTQTRIEEVIDAVPRPAAIDLRIGGQKADMDDSLDSLTMALLLAVFLVYVVMASQFESLVQPLIILCSLPLALVGVVFVLEALNIPISVVVLLGAIVLAGIVVNNAIILVDQINRFRREGVAKFEAIARGARIRLRPVLMTTLTTVLGLLPLTGWLQNLPIVGSTGEGLELRAPLAITVIAGLLASTLLTLVVIPTVYSVVDRKP